MKTHTIDWREYPLSVTYEIVMNGWLTRDAAQQLAEQIYEDKRGGYLCDLLDSDEFLDALYTKVGVAA